MTPPKQPVPPPRPPSRCGGPRAPPRRWLEIGRRPPTVAADRDLSALQAGCFRRHDEAVHRIQALWDAAGVPQWHRALYTEHCFADEVPVELLLQEVDALERKRAPVQVASKAVEAREEVLDALVQLRLSYDDNDFFEESGVARRSLVEQLIALRQATMSAVEAIITWRRTFTLVQTKAQYSGRYPSHPCPGVVLHKQPCWPHGKTGEDYLRTIASNDTVVRTFGFILDLPSFCDPFVVRPEESGSASATVGIKNGLRLPILRTNEIEKVENLRFLLRDELHVSTPSKALPATVAPRRAHCASKSVDVDYARARLWTPSHLSFTRPELPQASPRQHVSAPRQPRPCTPPRQPRPCTRRTATKTHIDVENAMELKEIVECSTRATSEASGSPCSSLSSENVGASSEVCSPVASSSAERLLACTPDSPARRLASALMEQLPRVLAIPKEASSVTQRAATFSTIDTESPELISEILQSALVEAQTEDKSASANAEQKSTGATTQQQSARVPGSTSPKDGSDVCADDKEQDVDDRLPSVDDASPRNRGPRPNAESWRASIRKCKTVQPKDGRSPSVYSETASFRKSKSLQPMRGRSCVAAALLS
eukprot:TRINITY_DN11229_c0_g2_i1.p1 TRINITY_DN11229_c0_g2~~TRINITY_DN11229_c0_g2_i1.p1  ORF type:complete len:600 (-),score=53.21 TRINITY_DN11229_c0_g2_i1:559-2358(-)